MNVERFWYANQTTAVPAAWHYASGVVSLICLMTGVISNGLVLFVFIRNDVLQKPRNYFLINLAITDLGLLLTNNSMHVISSFRTHWIFGQKGCSFYSVCGGVFGLTSIATMASISLNRLAAVNDPFSSLKLSSRATLRCLACTWIYGSVWILPPLFGWNRFILEGFGTSCTFDYVSTVLRDRLFILMLMTGGFFIPLSVILLAYCSILSKLSERRRDLTPKNDDETHRKNRNVTTFTFNHLNVPGSARIVRRSSMSLDCNDQNNVSRNMRRTEARATRTALLICALFCLAWGPYALMALISLSGFNHLVNAYITSVLGILTKFAACVNPIIYAISSSGFREQIHSYIKRLYPCEGRHAHHLEASPLDLSRRNLSQPLNLSLQHQSCSTPIDRDSL